MRAELKFPARMTQTVDSFHCSACWRFGWGELYCLKFCSYFYLSSRPFFFLYSFQSFLQILSFFNFLAFIVRSSKSRYPLTLVITSTFATHLGNVWFSLFFVTRWEWLHSHLVSCDEMRTQSALIIRIKNPIREVTVSMCICIYVFACWECCVKPRSQVCISLLLHLISPPT